MLFKLLKYDFRAMWKQFSLIWGAALALALVNRFVIRGNIPFAAENIPDLVALTFGAVLVAMFVIAIGFVINRFSKGLLGNEGYLMHTLPVRPRELVLSKLICGTVTWVISGAVAFASPFLMVPIDWSIFVDFRFWSDVFRGLSRRPDTLLLAAEFFLMVLSCIVQTIAAIYLSASVGHLVPRHKRLVSTAAFIGLYVLLANSYTRVFLWGPFETWMDTVSGNIHASMLTASATMLIPAGLFLAAVCWILEHKLNLE